MATLSYLREQQHADKEVLAKFPFEMTWTKSGITKLDFRAVFFVILHVRVDNSDLCLCTQGGVIVLPLHKTSEACLEDADSSHFPFQFINFWVTCKTT